MDCAFNTVHRFAHFQRQSHCLCTWNHTWTIAIACKLLSCKCIDRSGKVSKLRQCYNISIAYLRMVFDGVSLSIRFFCRTEICVRQPFKFKMQSESYRIPLASLMSCGSFWRSPSNFVATTKKTHSGLRSRGEKPHLYFVFSIRKTRTVFLFSRYEKNTLRTRGCTRQVRLSTRAAPVRTPTHTRLRSKATRQIMTQRCTDHELHTHIVNKGTKRRAFEHVCCECVCMYALSSLGCEIMKSIMRT